ncbi:hypothetical protein HAX54_035743 [Datura stramonium]|uniref:Uncharacterized protein n=1 Tax=Datura stramonium TaxID=4076 RepID=A0ABS8SFI9_DATST|nr:hypothetical protein [Datura stramonium]
MKTRQEDNIIVIKNFLQVSAKYSVIFPVANLELNLDIVPMRVGEENGDLNMYVNLLTVAITGNATFLDELLKAKSDPDIGDAQRRTPLHQKGMKSVSWCFLDMDVAYTSEVYSIRDAAANNLKCLAEKFGPEWAMQHIIPVCLTCAN